MNKIILLLAILLFTSCKDTTKIEITTPPPAVDSVKVEHLSLIFVGDVMTHLPQINAAIDSTLSHHNFDDCFEYVAPYWREADVVIANLETTLSEKNFSGYPRFAAPYSLADALKKNGVTHMVLANNHVCDYLGKGIDKTTSYLEQIDIPYTGAFRDSTSWRENSPLLIEHGSFRVALLNYTYGTNGMPVAKGKVVMAIDSLSIGRDIARAQDLGATNIVVFIHWGDEYQRRENQYQRNVANFLRSKGVDIIIGSHPHVVQGVDVDSTGVTVYSLGNFISNQRDRYRNGGINIHLNLTRIGDSTIYDTKYKSYYVYKTEKKPRYFCLDSLAADTIITDLAIKKEANIFFNDTRSHLKNIEELKIKESK